MCLAHFIVAVLTGPQVVNSLITVNDPFIILSHH
jgi:hypothetical protein